jgi:hypothetical protein
MHAKLLKSALHYRLAGCPRGRRTVCWSWWQSTHPHCTSPATCHAHAPSTPSLHQHVSLQAALVPGLQPSTKYWLTPACNHRILFPWRPGYRLQRHWAVSVAFITCARNFQRYPCTVSDLSDPVSQKCMRPGTL